MTTVACLGTGRIGGEVAYVSALKGFADELVLYDINPSLLHAQKLDLIHGLDTPVSTNPADFKNADYCIFSAGYSRSPKIKTRADLFDRNIPIAKEAADQLKGFSGKLIVITNPMDIFTWYFAKHTTLDEGQVVGFGGLLDSRRFTIALKTMGITKNGIVLGEHGEHQIPLFSKLGIDVPIPVREEILTGLRGSSMPIIRGKAGTVFGPASNIVSLMQKIEKSEKTICSLPANGAYGIEGCSLGLPAVVTKNSAKIDESLRFDPWEQEKLNAAVDFLRELCRRV